MNQPNAYITETVPIMQPQVQVFSVVSLSGVHGEILADSVVLRV